jgi:TP901 family phage tail tape measure protein
MSKRFSVEAIFKAVDKVTAPVRKMQTRVGKFTAKIDKGLRVAKRASDKLASGLKKAAAVAVISFAVITAALVSVNRVGMEFEQTLVTSAAKFGILNRHTEEGAKSYKKLEDAARSMGTTTEFTAQQSAEALNFLAMAGFNAEQAVAALPGVLDLATAAGVELAQASDIATDSLGAFNLMTDDTVQLQKNLSRVNDVLAATTNSANTNMEQMFEAMKDGGPVATAAGASIETFAALTGKLADAGIKGSKAGTTLKNMFLKLSAPTAGASKLLQRYGVQTKDAQGNMLDIVDILGDLDGALKDLGTADRANVLNEIFGLRAIAGVNVLLGVGADKIHEYRKALEASDGASKKLAAAMRDTFAVEWLNLLAIIDDVKLTIFELIKGPMKEILTSIKNWVVANTSLFKSIGKAFAWIFSHPKLLLAVAIVIGILVGALTALITTVSILSGVMTAFNFILAANPVVLIIGLIVAGIVALIAVLAVAVVFWEDWTKWLRESSTTMKVVLGLVALILGPLAAMAYLLALVGTYWEEISEVASIAFAMISDGLGNLADIFELVGLTISNTWAKVTDFIMEAWGEVGSFLSSMWTSVLLDFKKAGHFMVTMIDKLMLKTDKLRSKLPGFAGGLSDADLASRTAARSQEASARLAEISAMESKLAGGEAPKVLGPEAAMTREIRETKDSAELTIRDETGRAEITGGNENMRGVNLIASGAF